MKIQLAQYELELSDRYREGSIISESEAKVLNVARSERIRNRVARWLDRNGPKDGSIMTGDDLAALKRYAAGVDATFEFETRDVTKSKRGTLEAEIREIAQERAEALARERGRAGDSALVAQLFEALLDDPEVEILAAMKLEARAKVALDGLATL